MQHRDDRERAQLGGEARRDGVVGVDGLDARRVPGPDPVDVRVPDGAIAVRHDGGVVLVVELEASGRAGRQFQAGSHGKAGKKIGSATLCYQS